VDNSVLMNRSIINRLHYIFFNRQTGSLSKFARREKEMGFILYILFFWEEDNSDLLPIRDFPLN
jgi:hypothetical protein